MLLSIGTVGYLEVDFFHTHDGHLHRHSAAVADPLAHQLSHRLDGRKAGSRSVLRED